MNFLVCTIACTHHSHHSVAHSWTTQTLLDTFESVAILLFATAEDDNDINTATTIALFVLEQQRELKHLCHQGLYNAEKCLQFYSLFLNDFTDWQFKRWLWYAWYHSVYTIKLNIFYRVNWNTFWHLYSFIKDDPIFISKGTKPQWPSEY